MLNISRALRSDRLLRATTGYDRKRFEELVVKFAPFVLRVKYKRNRKRKAGGGRPHTLKTSAEKLFYMLLYMKCYPTFDLAGFFFQVDRSQAKRWVDELGKKLEKALGEAMVLPERRIRSVKEFLEKFPALKELIIDGTERAVQRPKDKQKQKERFNGIAKDYPLRIVMPFRKLRTKELTKKQKQFNKKVSRFRVLVENALAGVKRLRCITDVCRNKNEEFKDRLMWLSCGLWN